MKNISRESDTGNTLSGKTQSSENEKVQSSESTKVNNSENSAHVAKHAKHANVANHASVPPPSPRAPLPLEKQNIRLLTPKEYAKRVQKRPQLGIHARISSSPSGSLPLTRELGGSGDVLSEAVIPEDALLRRFWLQSVARDLMRRYCQEARVCACLRLRQVGQGTVNLFYSSKAQRAHYGGLQICGSVWACPVCAAKISERRRCELQEGLKRWGGHVLLVTFTLRHQREDSLTSVLATLRDARKRLTSGREANTFRKQFPYVGMIRALETTYGEHGWHPHMHVLYFFRSLVDVPLFTHEMKSRWGRVVGELGGSATYEHGVDVRFADQDIADYVAKWGHDPQWTAAHELTKAAVKKGRVGGYTPQQLLMLAGLGWHGAGERWVDYAINLKGERQLWWSQGLRSLLGLEKEQTDEEVAAEQVDDGAILLAQLNSDDWEAILKNDARAELLQVASSGDVEQVYTFLERLGLVR